jgi:hypothetical protein
MEKYDVLSEDAQIIQDETKTSLYYGARLLANDVIWRVHVNVWKQ